MKSNITEIPHQGEMICGHGHEQKFKYPYFRDSKIIHMPHPRAKVINQIPALCPAPRPSPTGLTLIGAQPVSYATEACEARGYGKEQKCRRTWSTFNPKAGC